MVDQLFCFIDDEGCEHTVRVTELQPQSGTAHLEDVATKERFEGVSLKRLRAIPSHMRS